MVPPITEKNVLSENTELRKALMDMERELAVFKHNLSEKKESPESKEILSIEDRYHHFERKMTVAIDFLMNRSEALEERMDAMEQYSRRKSLLIHGIPETKDENCVDVALAVFRDKLNISIDSIRIDEAHRVGLPRTKTYERPRPVVIKFMFYNDRHLVWTSKRSLKGTGLLITEFLTAIRKSVLYSARDLAGPRKVWTQDGKVVVQRPDGVMVNATTIRDVEAVRSCWTLPVTTEYRVDVEFKSL
ncbi:hypothetical protein J437_LFUL018416 [Ladona fulva]|uniref:Uncharacterized protein n=1 Tax=Ladona fulva TaxID=123851 RepID=A0A8K0P8X5_LADFU|nr:hypothetical protein J437_LFUL018416 [Ladona fulva]